MKAELVPDNGDPPIPITRDLTVIGRRDYCDVVIHHASLSKRHCVLVKTDGLLVLRDLASTNGTKVKGQRVRWAALLPDDRVTLGSYKLRVYLGPDDAPGPSELAKWGAPARRPAAPPRVTSDAENTIRAGGGGFAAPSPLGTPSVNGSGRWEEDPGESADIGWPSGLAEVSDDDDDVVIELD
jgi:predicted component of type VI protein secretion system